MNYKFHKSNCYYLKINNFYPINILINIYLFKKYYEPFDYVKDICKIVD